MEVSFLLACDELKVVSSNQNDREWIFVQWMWGELQVRIYCFMIQFLDKVNCELDKQ